MAAAEVVINDKREIFAWAMHDWANSAFSTTGGTVFLGPYVASLAASAAKAYPGRHGSARRLADTARFILSDLHFAIRLGAGAFSPLARGDRGLLPPAQTHAADLCHARRPDDDPSIF